MGNIGAVVSGSQLEAALGQAYGLCWTGPGEDTGVDRAREDWANRTRGHLCDQERGQKGWAIGDHGDLALGGE